MRILIGRDASERSNDTDTVRNSPGGSITHHIERQPEIFDDAIGSRERWNGRVRMVIVDKANISQCASMDRIFVEMS